MTASRVVRVSDHPEVVRGGVDEGAAEAGLDRRPKIGVLEQGQRPYCRTTTTSRTRTRSITSCNGRRVGSTTMTRLRASALRPENLRPCALKASPNIGAAEAVMAVVAATEGEEGTMAAAEAGEGTCDARLAQINGRLPHCLNRGPLRLHRRFLRAQDSPRPRRRRPAPILGRLPQQCMATIATTFPRLLNRIRRLSRNPCNLLRCCKDSRRRRSSPRTTRPSVSLKPTGSRSHRHSRRSRLSATHSPACPWWRNTPQLAAVTSTRGSSQMVQRQGKPRRLGCLGVTDGNSEESSGSRDQGATS